MSDGAVASYKQADQTHSCESSRLSVTNVIIVCQRGSTQTTFSGTEVPHLDNGFNDLLDFYPLTA